MKDPSAEANATPAGKRTQLATITDKKLKANRENAKKSTGPKTLRGKAYSRCNAVKHGLFSRGMTDFEALHEDPQQYEELLTGLWDQHEPVGKAEEIEVERIAICCWRLKRAWRYENAANLAARRDFVRAELQYQEPYCKERDKEEEAIVLLLREAEKSIEETGEVSQELKQRIVALVPPFESLWATFNNIAQEQVSQPSVSPIFEKFSPRWRSWVVAMKTVKYLIREFEQMANRRWMNVWEAACGTHAIPNSEVLDRLLRYETTIDRALNRALDRLDRLQRRRLGQPVCLP
jgi:hypothetical protein